MIKLRKSTHLRTYNLLFVLLILPGLACSLTGRIEGTPVTASATASVVVDSTSVSFPQETVVPQETPEIQTALPSSADLRVVYVKEGNLWIWEQGDSIQLTTSGEVYRPQISPDGKIVAFLRPADEFHLEIWAINIDGTNEKRLVSIADLDAIGGGVRDPSSVAINPYHYDWAPGTHVLAFNTHQAFQGPGLSLLNDLNLVDADNLKITNLFLSGWGGEFTYSPDGSQIAISQPDKVILANADGSNYRPVFDYPAVTTYSEYRYYVEPNWAEDGKSIQFALPPVDPLAEPRDPTTLWKIEVESSQAEQMGSILTVPFFEQPTVLSPDLMRVAYLQEIEQPSENQRELHLAASDGSGDWMYSKAAPILFLSWGLDSITFLYSVGEEQETWLGSIQELPRQLDASFNGLQEPRWVDASHFLGWVLRDGEFRLILAGIDGSLILLDTVSGAPPNYDFSS